MMKLHQFQIVEERIIRNLLDRDIIIESLLTVCNGGYVYFRDQFQIVTKFNMYKNK